jgi:PAS domain S-box-containing protein
MQPLRAPSKILSLIVIVVGAVGLTGWLLDISSFKTVLPGLVTMKANTGICLMLLGTSLFLLENENASGPIRRIAQMLAAFSALVGALSLSEHVFGWNLGIDQLLFRESLSEAGPSFPGRMGPAACLDFLLLGSSLVLIDWKNRRDLWLSPYLAAASMPITLLAFLSYFYGVQPISSLTIYSSIALHTVGAFLALCAGILLARPAREFMPSLLSSTPGAILARRLLPAALLLPPFLGWLAVLGRKANLYGPHYGTAWVVTMLASVFSLLIVLAARAVNTSEAERARGERALNESESRFRSLAENIPQLAWMTDETGAIAWYNKRWFDYTGTTLEEMKGLGWEKVHDPEHLQRVTENFKRALASVQPWEDTFPLRSRDGDFRWFLSRAFPIKDAQDRVLRWFGTNTDISDLRAIQDALVEREAVLRTVTSEARVGLVMVSQERRYLFANNTYADILGLPNSHIVGKKVPDVLAHLYEQIAPNLDRAFQGHRVSYELRLPRHPVTGDERYYDVIYQPRTEGPSEPYVVVVLVDITERKKIQERLEHTVAERTAQLREANANLQTFSYSAAHDLRSPLRTIQSINPEAKGYLERVVLATNQMGDLLHDLLDYSKLTQAEIELEKVNLNDLVRDALGFLDRDIQAHGAALTVQHPLPSVIAHPATLLTVMQNLISNALKFMPPGGQPKVNISAEEYLAGDISLPSGDGPVPEALVNHRAGPDNLSPRRFIRLSVRDNGIGIPSTEISKLFTAFNRLHGKDDYPGTGLGLAIVHKAAERMGGRVGVESKPGEGSRFWIELPGA